jgi:hypothetical protein
VPNGETEMTIDLEIDEKADKGDAMEVMNEQENNEILTFLSRNKPTESERKKLKSLELCTEIEVIHAVRQLIADR